MLSLILKSAAAVIRPYRSLPGGVYILFLARIINRMGDFANFFLTLYLTRYLGFGEQQTGAVLSFLGLCMMAGALLGGKLTDLAGRKTLMLILQSLAALCVFSCGFMPDNPAVAYLLLIFTFFNGAVRPINTALLTDLTRAEQRSSAFSLLYLGINIGVSAGPILAGFLFNHYRQWIFWGDALTTAITIVLILLFIREPAHHEMKLDEKEEHVEGHSFKALAGVPVLLWYAPLTVLSSFIYAQHNFALPLHIMDLFGENSARLYGFVMSFNALTVLALTPVFNHVMTRFAPLRRIAFGQLLYGVGFGILFFPVSSVVWIFLSTLLWTAGEILDATNSGVVVANNSPVNHRGRFNSFFHITRGGGRALGPLVSGMILERAGMPFIWLVCLSLGGVLYVAMLRLEKFK